MNAQEKYNYYISHYKSELSKTDTREFLRELCRENKAAFSTSFGKEDQVLTDILVKNSIPARIFTLDTGRLFNETYSLHRRTNDLYKIKIETWFPDQIELQGLINSKGPDSFFDSVENRLECCQIRKVNPLKKALAGTTLWITGLRREQSDNRSNLQMIEYDAQHDIVKIHPLINWSDNEIESWVETHRVPVNSLHAKGYPSIGCAPCTRAILPGEHSRAGRWSWEAGKKECGLHTHK